ncbi:MAG: leucine-rich repeat protein, partial [Oscillospiraceae bacterium]|nr:leucine-rich repeat protein [Oscillospiraceae bacterium]
TATAYNLVNKRLVEVADFDTDNDGFSDYAGNGNHNLAVGDVDGDGCDEIICGSLALDNDFSVLWCSGRGHGDALHLADYDPVHEGPEYFSVHESSPYGMTLYDASTGEEIFHADGTGDTGAGMMANVGYAEGYYEIWGAGTYYSTGGDNIQEGDYTPASYRFRIFWDGNTYDELLDGTGSGDSNIKIDGKDGRVFTIENAVTNNDTKNNPCLTADILGDWREEIVARGTDNASLVVYTTTKTTEHKLYTLMHDRAYRMQVASQNAGYNQPPHISYYIDEDNSEYDCRKYAAYVTTVHDGETAVRTANLPSDKPDVTAPVKTPVPYQTFEVENGIITAYDGNTASLTVPETIDGETITGIGNKAFYGNEYLTEVILPDTVTSIGTSAFSGCTALESITMNNVTSFGKRVFYKCAALKSAVIADGTENIETDIFSGCTALESLTIPREVTEKLTVSSDNITVYGYVASLAEYFYSDNFAVIEGMEPTETDGWLIDPQGTVCGYTGDETELKITSEAAGAEVNRIAALAFYNNESIESIVIPEGVTRIDDGNYSRFASSLNNGAFYGCSALKSVEIPQSMEYIGENAFRGCTSLESMELPDTVNTIGTAAFYGCTALESAVLPESVESAGSYMLYGCSALKSVTVPDGWTEIPNYMFCGCTSLVSAVLPENSESGGMYLFSGCSALESVNIPAGWTEIPSQMLQGCASLISIEIPESITDINANAFAESGLQSVSIPNSVTYMGTGAFYMCEALTEVTLSKNTEAICSGSFYGCIALEEIEIPESVTEICGADTAQSVGNTYGDENGAFEGCTALKKAVIPASVTSIGDGAFDGCEGLVIYGYTNSEAESYAAANDIEFVSIGTVEKALPCAVSDVSETEDGYIRITLEISDELWDDKPEELMIIAAFYAEDGTLLSASPEYIGGVSYTFEKASDFYKIFIWDMEDMMPYSYAYCNY